MNKDEFEKHTTQFHLHYGKAMSSWAGLENSLYFWFAAATGMTGRMARAVFYTARGFSARAEMLLAALEHATKPPAVDRELLKEALKKARSYASYRNRIAHGEPRVQLFEHREKFRPLLTIDDGRKNPAEANSILLDDLDRAAANIHELSMLLIERYPGVIDRSRTPEEWLASLRALPSEANGERNTKPRELKDNKLPRPNKKALKAQREAKSRNERKSATVGPLAPRDTQRLVRQRNHLKRKR
jgi:hypothetical protein